jgi:hypothetical protein
VEGVANSNNYYNGSNSNSNSNSNDNDGGSLEYVDGEESDSDDSVGDDEDTTRNFEYTAAPTAPTDSCDNDGDNGHDLDEITASFYCANSRHLITSPLSRFLSLTPWFEREDFIHASQSQRASVVTVVNTVLRSGKDWDNTGEDSSCVMSLNNNTRSAIILTKGNAVLTVLTFTLQTRVSRSYAELGYIRTRKRFRRNGYGTLALALLKEIVIKSPLKDKPEGGYGECFLWGSVTSRAEEWFKDSKRGCLLGWGSLRQIFSNVPAVGYGEKKMHVLLEKVLLGEYVKAGLKKDSNPVKEDKKKKSNRGGIKRDWDTVPEFTVGSTVYVRYPRATSTKLYTGIVLDYNVLGNKPYLIQYQKGSQLDFVIPKRIIPMMTENEVADNTEGLWIGDHTATPPPVEDYDDEDRYIDDGAKEELRGGDKVWRQQSTGNGAIAAATAAKNSAPVHNLFNGFSLPPAKKIGVAEEPQDSVVGAKPASAPTTTTTATTVSQPSTTNASPSSPAAAVSPKSPATSSDEYIAFAVVAPPNLGPGDTFRVSVQGITAKLTVPENLPADRKIKGKLKRPAAGVAGGLPMVGGDEQSKRQKKAV